MTTNYKHEREIQVQVIDKIEWRTSPLPVLYPEAVDFMERRVDDIFKGIAKKMDVENLFTEGRDEEDWQKWIYQETSDKSKSLKNIDFPSYQEFRKIGWFKVPPPKENTIMLKDF